MTKNWKITKAEAYDMLAKTIAMAFTKSITTGKAFGSEYERGMSRAVMNLLAVVREIDEHIIPTDDKKEV